jgi:hypothetical protein
MSVVLNRAATLQVHGFPSLTRKTPSLFQGPVQSLEQRRSIHKTLKAKNRSSARGLDQGHGDHPALVAAKQGALLVHIHSDRNEIPFQPLADGFGFQGLDLVLAAPGAPVREKKDE